MGRKMVTGQGRDHADPRQTPLASRTVQAAHDADNLYLRQRGRTPSVAVPFVDGGGKMDPANQVKLAVMLATDEVKVRQPGRLLGTCHDLPMPGHPEDPGPPVCHWGWSHGVTKYIAASAPRSRNRVGAEDPAAGTSSLMPPRSRPNSPMARSWTCCAGTRTAMVENGHVLDQRVMSGGAAVEAQGHKPGPGYGRSR